MKKITLEEYKRILSLSYVDMFYKKEPNLKAKKHIEKEYSDNYLEEIITNTENFIKRLLIVLKNQQSENGEDVIYNFELPLNLQDNLLLNGSEEEIADELFYLDDAESQKISIKLINYLLGKDSLCYLKEREVKEPLKGYSIFIPTFNIIISIEDLSKIYNETLTNQF